MKSSTSKSLKKKFLKTSKEEKPVRIKKDKPAKIPGSEMDGLNQTFKSVAGNPIKLKDFLTESDWWTLKTRSSFVYIVLHDAVKKIAREAGINTDPEYSIMIPPSVNNNYTTVMQVKICDSTGKCTTDIGEVSRDNLGSRGRNNPVNMAQKRAFDRAVFNHLGITGLLGEDEIQEDEEKNTMDDFESLPDEEKKIIAPLLNQIFAAKIKPDLMKFKAEMVKQKVGLNEAQLSVLRKRWTKKLAELSSSF